AYSRFAKSVRPHLVGEKGVALDRLLATYEGTRRVFARGTVDVIPTALCQEPLRAEIMKNFPTLKAGCRKLDVAYRLVFSNRWKGGIRRDTLSYIAKELASPMLESVLDPRIGWSRAKGFVREGVEPTYDFEVPGANSFIANGI